MKPSTIGLDIAKSVFHLHGVDASGAVVLRKRLRRRELVAYFAKLEPCLIGLEACGGGHHWARELAALGHQVRLLSPADVKPYVRRNKNDAIDAAAICEAVSRPSMRFVPVKSRAQQAALVPHRVRDLLVRQRTMLINTLRSLMAEFGVVAPRGRGHLGALAARLEEPEAASPSNPAIPAAARPLLLELVAAIAALSERIARAEKAIVAAVRKDPLGRRLMTVPGVGPITASAVLATVGEPARVRNGRHFAAWLGLVAKQSSTGGRPKLGRISKMGDRYLRRLLVLGATARLACVGREQSPLAAWTRALLARRPARLVTVALANKTARILWAVMARGEAYRPEAAAA